MGKLGVPAGCPEMMKVGLVECFNGRDVSFNPYWGRKLSNLIGPAMMSVTKIIT